MQPAINLGLAGGTLCNYNGLAGILGRGGVQAYGVTNPTVIVMTPLPAVPGQPQQYVPQQQQMYAPQQQQMYAPQQQQQSQYPQVAPSGQPAQYVTQEPPKAY